jgi:general secretion pathway protein D
VRATEVFLKFRSAALTGTALAVILTGLSGCGLESDGADPSNVLPKKTPNELAAEPKSAIISNSVERRKEPTIEVGPAPPQGQSGEIPASKTLPVLTGQVADVSIEQMPIPAFINTVLGETLHLTFEIDPKVSAKTDVVTLRTGGPKSAEELLMITREVLRTYGISLSSERNLVRVRLSESLTSEMPQIIIGRTAADLAENLRPVFQVLVLDHVNNQDMASWLQSAFGSKIKFIPSPANNSIILLGLPDDVKSASEGIRLLDQPRLAGRQSLKITPVFWTAATLAEKLGDVLRAEGYNVSSAPVPPAAVTLLPLPTANMVLAFATDTKILEHVGKWAKDLDRPAQVDPRQSVFYYPVRNTTADSLVKVLNEVISGDASSSPTSSDLQQPGLLARASNQQQPAQPGAKPSGNTRFIPDTARNALIFLGSAEAYAQVLPLIQSLDQAPREVLIEVTIANVTLNDEQELGIEWSKVGANLGGNIVSFSGGNASAPGTGFGAPGVFLQVLSAKNSVAATLSALQSTSHTKVVSTPRILARSGATAKIQVGQDIPVVTSQVSGTSFTPGQGSLQSVSYVNTGNLIQVKPVIYAGNQIDLDISQQQSLAQANSPLAVAGSPPINDQNVSTQLSLTDGQTVLLGGFINDDKTDSSGGVPGLMDVPVIGTLFRNNDVSVSRTETLIFITPYIINSNSDSERIIDSVREDLKQYPEVHQTVVY